MCGPVRTPTRAKASEILAQLTVWDALSRRAMDDQLEHPSLAMGINLDGRTRVRIALIAPQKEVACMYTQTHTKTDNRDD